MSNNNEINSFTLWDILLIVILLGVAIAFIPYFYTNQPAKIVVYRDNAVSAEYSLNQDREFVVAGHDGDMVVKIDDNHVAILSSTCKEQICVKSGKISRPYQQLICAPNHVLIEIHSSKADRDVDAITR